MVELLLWHKIALYILLLASLFIYVKTANIKINGIPLLRPKYRLLLALFFPVILIAAFFLGSILIALGLIAVLLITLYSFFTKRKIQFKIKRAIPKRPLN